jgi:hypothetical protein
VIYDISYHISFGLSSPKVLVITHKCSSPGERMSAGERQRGGGDEDSSDADQQHTMSVTIRREPESAFQTPQPEHHRLRPSLSHVIMNQDPISTGAKRRRIGSTVGACTPSMSTHPPGWNDERVQLPAGSVTSNQGRERPIGRGNLGKQQRRPPTVCLLLVARPVKRRSSGFCRGSVLL